MLYDFIPKKNDSACTILFVVYGRSVSRFFALWTVCGISNVGMACIGH